jgi:FKBP-type peptidyl-prolyl cis-trans isomerase (trigger factor)
MSYLATVEGSGRPVTREEIEKRMDELARKYVETRDSHIIEKLNRLSRQLQELEKHFRL